MSKPIVVTGGAGFIGRNIVAELNGRAINRILVVDHLGTSEKWRNLQGLDIEDYLDKQTFLDLVDHGKMPTPQAVFHMGACSSTTERDAGYLMENNYRYTRRLCEWCLATGARFITASSAATYGDGSQGYSDDDAVTPTLRPLNMYGFSKQLFDLWALRNDLYNRIVGLKFFNVYGPGEAHKGDMRSVVHKAFGQIRERGFVELFKSHRPDYNDGEQSRDFIYVKDAVSVLLHFFDHPEVNGLYNCGTGHARTWNDLVHAAFSAMNREPQIRYIDMPEAIRDKYQYHTEADMTKLRTAGYTNAFTSLEDGVADYVRNHLTGE